MPKRFKFNIPTRIEIGEGLLKEVGVLARELIRGKKAFVVTDPGVLKTGLAGEVVASLKEKGFDCRFFEQVEANPKDIHCEAGGEDARLFGADVVVAVGGGSVIDAAKVIALLQTNEGPVRLFEGKVQVARAITPVIAVPTTAGSGSEVTHSAVITDTERKFKMTIKKGTALAPKLAVVDPKTTYSLPPALTASTGMDALVHAIEAYTCRLANPISDAMALAAVENIYPSLPLAVDDGKNREARYALMVGSLLGGMAFSHSDVASVHCMAEALGGLYDTPHGVANSIFLPYVTAYNAEADPERHARVASACGLPVSELSAGEAASLLVVRLAELAVDIAIPEFSSLTGINREDFAHLAEASMQNNSSPSNCRPIGKHDYLRLFQEAYAGNTIREL